MSPFLTGKCADNPRGGIVIIGNSDGSSHAQCLLAMTYKYAFGGKLYDLEMRCDPTCPLYHGRSVNPPNESVKRKFIPVNSSPYPTYL